MTGGGVLRRWLTLGAFTFVVYMVLYLVAATTGSELLWSWWVFPSLPGSSVAYIVYFVTAGFIPENWGAAWAWLPTATLVAMLQGVFFGGVGAAWCEWRGARQQLAHASG